MRDEYDYCVGCGEVLPQACAGDVCKTCDDEDPTPYCSHCGAKTKSKCDCGPIPDND